MMEMRPPIRLAMIKFFVFIADSLSILVTVLLYDERSP
jgi:hypothetical protein